MSRLSRKYNLGSRPVRVTAAQRNPNNLIPVASLNVFTRGDIFTDQGGAKNRRLKARSAFQKSLVTHLRRGTMTKGQVKMALRQRRDARGRFA